MHPLFSYPVFCPTGGYNELIDTNGQIRAHWRDFITAFQEKGEKQFSNYAAQSARLMNADIFDGILKQENFHNIIPFILPRKDFQIISEGLIQRARLINQILCDLYTRQELITQNIIPPEIVFSNPSYQPALKNIKPPHNVFLQEYAADLERSPDGRFRIVADKTQTPEGIGLTIKNRLVLSKVMPEIYMKAAPDRIFDFFEAVRRHLFALFSENRKTEVPLVVLLSGHVKKQLSFEESFYARNLGISIAYPSDLTVRDDHVYLKNVDRLKPVDVILRRIDDISCDPLELDGSSCEGIAGLSYVVRKGNVALVNPLGTGLAESPALKAFFHEINRHFNAQDLLLPDADTRWCGRSEEKEYVIKHLSELEIYDITGQKRSPTAQEIIQNPENFIGQEKINASCTPVFQNGKLLPARTRLRFHLIHENGTYRILKGGLAFTQTDISGFGDIWVRSTDQEQNSRPDFYTKAAISTKPVRTAFELTSRTADNMFWLGRNLERSEFLARLLRTCIERATAGFESVEPDDIATLMSLLSLTGNLPVANFQDSFVQKRALEEMKDIIVSPNNPSGFYHLFSRIKEMADLLHDRLSMETWKLLTQMISLLPHNPSSYHRLLACLDNIILHQNALSGLIRENMTRDHSWRFMEIGRRLERGLQTLSLLSGIPFCTRNGFNASLETLLEVSDSRMTYRVRYMSVPVIPLVFDLLSCDTGNPRSLIYQVLKLRQNISVLKQESSLNGLFLKELSILENILKQINSIDVTALAEYASDPDKKIIISSLFETTLNRLKQELQQFSDTLTLSCFVHTGSTRQKPYCSKEG